jgi:hypothetical protein
MKNTTGIMNVRLYIDGFSGDIESLKLQGPAADYFAGPKKFMRKSKVEKVKKCLNEKMPDIPEGLLLINHLSKYAINYEIDLE